MNSLVYVDIWKCFTGIFYQASIAAGCLETYYLGMYYLVSTYIHILCTAFEKINVHKKRHTRCYISSALHNLSGKFELFILSKLTANSRQK